MNWFNGTIAEAVTASKEKNATFVVYVEGKDESSVKLTKFLDQPLIREKLERDCFVAIKIEGGSEAYMHFARIYQIVPLPSLFFIGKNGTPLEVATGVIASSEELDRKIENVLKITGNSIKSNAASSSAAFISGEQKQETEARREQASTKESSPTTEPEPEPEPSHPPINSTSQTSTELPTSDIETQPTTVSKPETSTSSSDGVYCNDGVCLRLPNKTQISDRDNSPDSTQAPNIPTPPATPPNTAEISDSPSPLLDATPHLPATVPSTTPPTPTPTPTSPPPEGNNPRTDEKLIQAKQLIEERKKLKQAEEERREREREVNRRHDGKNPQKFQKWQKEEDFKELKESIRRDRMEDQAARQRILEQIASDRAERAQKFNPPAVPATTLPPTPTIPTTLNPPNNNDMSRIQFRIPNGETNTQTFESSDTFSTVRAYVKGEVIKGTGIKDFTLATTFPKHEFTNEDDSQTLISLGLCPTAVILIIAKASSGPSAVVARSGGIVNVFNTVFWALLSPVMAIFGYVRNFIIGRNNGGPDVRPSNTGAQKRANEEDGGDPNDLAKKRNLDRFTLNQDGPSTSKEALASANATGGAYRRVGGSNIHRLSDQRKDSDDENNTWNGNSTQQQ